jgi:phosphoglycerate mutase, BPG-dependent, family 1
LQGVPKSEAVKLENYEEIRTSLYAKAPSVNLSDETHPSYDFKYNLVPAKQLPCSESLQDVENRVVPYWFDKIAPALLQGKNVLVVTHENTIRALRHYWKDYDDDVKNLEIANCIPRVYDFNEKLEILDKKDIGELDDIQDRIKRLNIF